VRRPLAIALALAAGVVTAACTRQPADERGGAVLKLMIWGAPDEVQTVKDYVKLFGEKHPNIDVVIQHAPDMGYVQKLNTRFLGGDPPDVFYLNFEDFPGVQSRGWLLPLDDLIAKDRGAKEDGFNPEAYFPQVYDVFKEGGKTYGIVKDFATLVLYYNKDLFDKYDVPYPKPGWTWTDFLAAARKIRHPEKQEYGIVLETWTGEWLPWVLQAGGKIVEQDPPRFVMGEEPYLSKNARAFQFLSDLIWKEDVAPNASVTRDQGTNDLFKNGKVGMCTYGRWMCMQFKEIHDFDWNVAELPRDEKPASTLFAVSYAVAKETKHKEAAWELVKFLTSKECEAAVGNSGQAIPSMESVARGPAFFDAQVLRGRGIDATPNVAAVAFADPGPSLLVWQEVRERLNRGLEALWNGTRRDAKAVLAEMQEPLSRVVATEEDARARARAQRGE
jgi:multiple sugar transport system substrate-binding protein